jgi:hypothetical protein
MKFQKSYIFALMFCALYLLFWVVFDYCSKQRFKLAESEILKLEKMVENGDILSSNKLVNYKYYIKKENLWDIEKWLKTKNENLYIFQKYNNLELK